MGHGRRRTAYTEILDRRRSARPAVLIAILFVAGVIAAGSAGSSIFSSTPLPPPSGPSGNRDTDVEGPKEPEQLRQFIRARNSGLTEGGTVATDRIGGAMPFVAEEDPVTAPDGNQAEASVADGFGSPAGGTIAFLAQLDTDASADDEVGRSGDPAGRTLGTDAGSGDMDAMDDAERLARTAAASTSFWSLAWDLTRPARTAIASWCRSVWNSIREAVTVDVTRIDAGDAAPASTPGT